MSTVNTTNYAWVMPVPGTEVDLWGVILNTLFQDIDTDVFSIQGTATAALPKAGGTMTGHITLPATAPTGTQAVSLSYLNANYAELSDIAGLAPSASPTFTGNPTAPTATPGDNDTSIATTAFVTAAVAASASAVPDASTTVKGKIEIATDAEVNTGTNALLAVVPASLTAKEATVAEYRNTTANKLLTTDVVKDAAAEVTITFASPTITVDFNTLINGIITMTGNTTLTLPANQKVGWSGAIRIAQDGTGSRTMAFHADWKFAGGTDPVLSTAPGAVDILFYQIMAANYIYASLVKGVA